MITLTMQPDDAEPILRQAAEDAAKYGAWVDHMTKGTGNLPCPFRLLEDRRKEWRAAFLRAKRIVESFGVEYEMTSEAETLSIAFHFTGGTRRLHDLGSLGKVAIVSGSKVDYSRPYPTYAGAVHAEACRQAASRVVRRWRASL